MPLLPAPQPLLPAAPRPVPARRAAAALAALLLALPLAAGAEAPSEEFASHGFRWTLPSEDWEFLPVSQDDVRYGWIARVRCKGAPIEAFAYVAPHNGLGLDERMEEVRQQGADGLGDVVASTVKASTLSGVKGAVFVARVKREQTLGHFRTYAIASGANFYQLMIRAWDGAHETHRDELNALRRGYRLAKGGGAEDADEAFDELPASAGADGEDGSADAGASRAAEGDTWGPNGPKREGNTVILPSHNFEWTLPEGSPFRWIGATPDEKSESGEFLIAAAQVPREKQEFEKDTPDHNFCRMMLIIPSTNPGFRVEQFIKQGGAQDFLERNRFVTNVRAAETRTKDDVNFGNWKAGFIKLEGQHAQGGAITVLMFVAQLRGKVYLVTCQLVGHTDAYKQFGPIIGEALGGIRFPNTKEPILGPLIGAIPEYSAPRGEALGEEREYVGPGFVFHKPKGLARVTVRDSMNQEVRHVCEGRSANEESYVYFEIRSFKLNIPNRPNIDPEEVVKKRIQDWEANAGPDAATGKNARGIAWKNGSFNSAKGLTYEFTGSLNGQPFVEEGWVVRHKSNLYSLRLQLGGPEAAKDLKDQVRAIKKGLKWVK